MNAELTPQELITMDDATFRDCVDRDLRGAAPEAHDNLRHPQVVPRWFNVLTVMFGSVESQLSSRRASHLAEMARFEQERIGQTDEAKLNAIRTKELELVHRFERQRSGSLRFKSGVQEVLTKARFLHDQFYPQTTTYKEERDALLRRVGRLEHGIDHHRKQTQAVGISSPDDQILWYLVPETEKPWDAPAEVIE